MKKIISAVFVGAFLLAHDVHSVEPPKNRIPQAEAEKKALKVYSGKIESQELEFENNKWVYSFDIRGEKNKLHEVQIDAVTGKVLVNKIESAKQEAQETAHDKAEKKAKTKK